MPYSDVSIRLATTKDVDAILKFEFKCFIKTEPVSVALGITEEEVREFITKMTNSCLNDSLSLVAVSEGEIVGIVLCGVKGPPESAEMPLDSLAGASSGSRITFPKQSKPMDVLRRYLHSLEANYKGLIPGCSEKIMHIEILCVDRARYGRRGLGMELTRRSLENAKKVGCSGVSASATSIRSQNLFSKAGFTILRVLKHDDIVYEDGKRIMHCKDGTNEGQLVFKEI